MTAYNIILDMFNLLKTIKYYLLSLKEKSLQKKLKNTTKLSYTNSTSKVILGSGAEVNISSEIQNKIKEVRENVLLIVKKVDCEPRELLNYIKLAKTPVIYLNNANKLLALLGEEEGLICEQKGLRALYLSIITGQGIKFNTIPMFVLRDGEIDKYYMLHHFYRWFSLKSGLPGFEYEVQMNFKKFLADENDVFLKSFSMEEMMSLKQAIARDQEASSFVIEYTKARDGSKNVLNKIKSDGSANI